MNESSIKPIGSIRPSEAGTALKPLIPNQTESAVSQKPAVSEPEEAIKPIETHSAQGESPSNVSIHFRLNEETNELTVFLVDRQTKRVLRSIPASELQKLQAGDLLKLTA
jgi:uncharacterized FlaG/YvyC family protein